jgi:hypothetical protein
VHQRPAILLLYDLFTKSFAAFAQLLEQKIYRQPVILNYVTNIISQTVFVLTGLEPFQKFPFLLHLKRVIELELLEFY